MAYEAGSFQATASHNFLSTFDLLKDQIDAKLYKAKGSHDLTGLIEAAGFMKPVSNKIYSHFEDTYIMPKIKATNGGAGSAGAAVTFTVVDEADLAVSMGNAPYNSTLTKYKMPVRKNDIIMIKPASGVVNHGTLIQAVVTAVTAPTAAGNGTFVAVPVLTGTAIPEVTSADEIIIIGNAHGENSAQPEAYITGKTKVSNNTQIIKETFAITGTAKAEKMWIEEGGKAGYIIIGEAETYQRFLNWREGSLLLSNKITNTTLANHANYGAAEEPIQMTQGLIPFCKTGTLVNYNSASGFTIDQLEALYFSLEKVRGASENLLYAGSRLSVNIDNEMGDRLQNGGITYGNFRFNQEKAVDFGFKVIRIGEMTFHKHTYAPFNHEQWGAADGFGFPYEAMVIPMDMRVDPVSREKIPSFSMNYLAEGGYSREMIVKPVSLLENSDSGYDSYEVRYISEIGLEAYGANRFGYIQRGS